MKATVILAFCLVISAIGFSATIYLPEDHPARSNSHHTLLVDRVAPNAELFVSCEEVNRSVYRFNNNVFQSSFGPLAFKPNGIAFDATGTLHITSNNIAYLYSKKGIQIGSYGSSFLGPNCDCIAIDDDGIIYIADAELDRISVLDSAGGWLYGISYPTMDHPQGIAFDRSGFLYISCAESENILRFERNGTFIDEFATGHDYAGIAFDTNENLYACDYNGNHFLKYDSTGMLLKTIEANGPRRITFDSKGHYFVVNSKTHEILEFDNDDNFITSFTAIHMISPKALALETSFSPHFVPDDFSTIQDAINAAVDGDTIIVRPGTYVENIDFLGKAITVRSEHGAGVTVILSNHGDVVTFINYEKSDSVLDGFIVTSVTDSGIRCNHSAPTLSNNIITGNDEHGINSNRGHSPTITYNIISGNGYSGIECNWSSYPTITNNIISGNHHSGIECNWSSNPTITNNIITRNHQSGIDCFSSSSPTITNTILWDNGGSEISLFSGCNPTVTFSDIEGSWPGNGNIDTDPLFLDPDNDDFHLTWNSPCRNTGDNATVTELFDFEGDPRIHDGTVDMGADEFHLHLYEVGTFLPGSTVDIKVVGPPSSKAWLLLGSAIQDPPQATWFGDLYLELPILDYWRLGLIPSNGVLSYPAIIPSWSSGKSFPFQAKVFSDKWHLSNLMALTVE